MTGVNALTAESAAELGTRAQNQLEGIMGTHSTHATVKERRAALYAVKELIMKMVGSQSVLEDLAREHTTNMVTFYDDFLTLGREIRTVIDHLVLSPWASSPTSTSSSPSSTR